MTQAYEARKDHSRERQAEQSKRGRDIAPIPEVENHGRRDACERDAQLFLDTYFPHLFTLPWSPDHRRAIAKAQQAVLMGGLFALAMPRGSGKTTILECMCLWAVLYGHRPFVPLIGPDKEHADNMLASIKSELENNELLGADFPEACYPVTRLEGIANRCRGQICEGERTHITWTGGKIVLPTIDGSKSSGAVIRAAGLTASIRGLKHKRPDGSIIRPSLFFCDDIQTDASAASLTQCESRERILSGAILGLAGPGQKISGLLAATVLRADDVADRLLDRTQHPDWNGERVAAMKSFPTATKLWDTYAELRAEDLRTGGVSCTATDYYIENQAEMDAGALAYWPERFNEDEVSAVQNLMNMKLQDETAFWAEQQNAPKRDQDISDEVSADFIAGKVSGRARGLVPVGTVHLTAFIDVHQDILYYAALAVDSRFHGSIVTYGTYPEQHRPWFTQRDAQPTLGMVANGAGVEGAIYDGLRATCEKLLGQEWAAERGGTMRVERCLIDANAGQWTDLIYEFCRQTPFAALVMPSHGRFFGASSTPLALWRSRPGEKAGLNWRISLGENRAIRHVIFDANFWKTFAAARLASGMGERGCWSLFGEKPEPHRCFADHLTSEYRVKTSAQGRTVDEWKLRPTRDNHWWDCVVGCAVAASICGASILEKPAPPKRVKLSERQKEKRRNQVESGKTKPIRGGHFGPSK